MVAHATPAAVLPASPTAIADASTAPEPRFRTAFIVTTALLAAAASGSWMFLHSPADASPSVLLVAALVIATIVSVRMPLMLGSFIASSETIPLVACVVLEPRLAVPLALATAFLVPGVQLGVRIVSGSQVVLAVTGALAVLALVFDGIYVNPGSYVIAVALASVSFHVVCAGATVTYEVLIWRERFATTMASIIGSTLATTVFAIPVTCIVVYGAHIFGPIALPLLLVPLAITQYFHGVLHKKLQLTDELADKAQILARTNLQFAAAMVRALDQRDAYTAGHSAAVAVFTRDIAREMGFDEETVRLAHLAGLLHDIGKIGVPGRVLNKTAPLDDDEYELMKTHAAMG
ncbi:MAG: HD-GYP/cache protein, partial [Thermoleophilia bacterium]|nr:HD-GYP/cache protein [Thermoleophilia bacterium]